MSSTLSSLQSKCARPLATEDRSWAIDERVDVTVRPADVDRPQRGWLPPGKRGAVSRFLIAFCIGVAASLGWQTLGDAMREMIASSRPQLGWLAPQAEPGAPSPDLQQLKAVST